jgi:hypothetical protein
VKSGGEGKADTERIVDDDFDDVACEVTRERPPSGVACELGGSEEPRTGDWYDGDRSAKVFTRTVWSVPSGLAGDGRGACDDGLKEIGRGALFEMRTVYLPSRSWRRLPEGKLLALGCRGVSRVTGCVIFTISA